MLIRLFAVIALVVQIAQAEPPCQRIVALAPSATEVAFSVGLGPRVVGVPAFASFPVEVNSLPKVGGFLDPNIELILSLKPDVVLVLTEFRDRISYLQRLGLRTLIFEHRSVQGILNSIEQLGEFCLAREAAVSQVKQLRQEIESIKARVEKFTPLRTMIVLGEGGNNDGTRSYFLSGKDGFYSDLLEIAGGSNVVTGPTFGAPTVSVEGVIALNPEVIVYIEPGVRKVVEANSSLALLKQLKRVEAVKNNRVYYLSSDYTVIPGPRFILLARDFLKLLHPEA